MEIELPIQNLDFRVMGKGRPVEVFEHIESTLSQHPEVELVIGCDSQNYSRYTVYVTAVVFRFPASGAHVIYHKERVSRIPDLWTKLWGETQRSVTLARMIEERCGVRVKQIDLDYNSDPSFPSHKLLGPSEGYIKSLGYQTAAKPALLMAVWAANAMCQ